MSNGLDEARVVAFANEVRSRNQAGLPLRVFSGIECDILKDGTMDLANDALAELDIVIGSVHSFMNLEPAEMTDRLLRALECPSLRVLGHLTGRIAAASRGLSIRFREDCGRSRAARRLAGNQRESGASGYLWTAASNGQRPRAANSRFRPTRIIPSICTTCLTAF